MSTDSLGTRSLMTHAGEQFHLASLARLHDRRDLSRLPFSLRILLENLLRHEDGEQVTVGDIEALVAWDGRHQPRELAFTPARVLLQDFTGVPAVVDLAAMRDAVADLGGSPMAINPQVPVELVIDHSVQVDNYARMDALDLNIRIEFARNRERYAFLRWGQEALENFRVVPPGTGIVHQVNLEYLARVVCRQTGRDGNWLVADTLVGTDSHTTMINGLGVLGWGVGGIEAEAAMLGQPLSMLLPDVIGVRMHGRLPSRVTATDLVLSVTERLRARGVVGCFVEFFGSGLDHLSLADRATIANMAPEYGATCGFFPIDQETLRYLRLSGRDEDEVALIEKFAHEQMMFRTTETAEPTYSDVVEIDLGGIVPSIAGPSRPQDRIPLSEAKHQVERALHERIAARSSGGRDGAGLERFMDEGGDTAIAGEESAHVGAVEVDFEGDRFLLRDGAVVIAAITSCTNTSNPAVMVAAGLLARKARQRGLRRAPWVKTSLAPGSQVVSAYLRDAGLLEDLEALGFHLVGYGCTTCIGNSGPLAAPIHEAIDAAELITAAVLSGNRNFEGRIHPQVQLNFLASPPLVVAYALAGTASLDTERDPLGSDASGHPVFLRDIWPSKQEIEAVISAHIGPHLFRERYANAFDGDREWRELSAHGSTRYEWDPDSSYIRKPPYFDGMSLEPEPVQGFEDARVLVLLGDSITTDHISPAGAIALDSPAGGFLREQGVAASDFNSYGSRRGNHEVMLRGTFANIRLRNQLAPGTEGGWTRHQPSGAQLSIYDAAMRYRDHGVPLLVIAGEEYGTGSSRDWAAKGTRLLGVKAVLASSFERIHRSNLVGMGVLPLQFMPDQSAATLQLTGRERYALPELLYGAETAQLRIHCEDTGTDRELTVKVRIDTPTEWLYYQHGGILPYMVRNLVQRVD